MERRTLLALGLAAAAPTSWAQQAPARKPAGPPPWRMLINEAVTGENNSFLLTARYQPLTDYITAHTKGQPIGVEAMVNIEHFMQAAQRKPNPELVFGKSVSQLAKLVRDQHYQPVVRRSDPYKSAFIVNSASPFKTLADAAKAKFMMPDELSATTAVGRAELRRQNIAKPVITHTRFQETVAQTVKAGMAEVGVVNPTVARKWVQEGGRVLAETLPVVNWSLLASPSLAAETVSHLRETLLGMNTQAPGVLAALGFKEWARAEPKDYLDLLSYTQE